MALLIWGGTSWAGFLSTKDQGTRGPTVLTLESGVRAQGLAGAYVGVADEVGALHWNPAGLQQLTRSEIQLMQANLVEGQKHQYLGVARPVWRRGERETWGFSASLLSMDEFEVVNDGESVGQAHPQETVVGLSYSRSVWGVSGGLTGKMVNVKTFDQSGQAYAVDLGVRSEGNGPWSWGAALTNLGTSLKLGQEKMGLPMVLRTGGARTWRGFRGGFLLASVQLDAPVDDRLGGRAGVECAGPLVDQWRWAARAGARTYEAEPFSVGAGVGFQSLEINYAFAPQSDWGDVHRFDLTWRFGQEIAPEARRRELLKKGTTMVREGRILEARPVLDELETLSPKNRDVRSLVQESQKRFAESLDPEALMVLGQKTYGAGEYSTAADLFRKILLVDSAHDGARAWLKKTESKMEEVRNVRLKKELDLSRQQELKKGIRLAERREAESDWGAALALWQKALALGGDSAKIQGRVQFCKEKLSEAAKHEEMRRQENARVAAESVNKLYKQGMEAYVAGELKKAKALFLEAQGLDPQNKNIRQALDHVEAELKLHPEKMRP